MSENGGKGIEGSVDTRAARVPRAVRSILVWVLLAAVAAGIVSFVGCISGETASADLSASGFLPLLLGLLVSCGVTAVLEEALFRGALLGALLYRLRELPHGFLTANVIAALVFALLHVLPELGLLISNPALVPSAMLKFVQAALFGFCMGAVVLEAKSILIAIGIHWLFDLLYFWPLYLFEGGFPSGYVMGDWVSLLVVGVSVLLFLPATIAAWRLPSLGVVGFSSR